MTRCARMVLVFAGVGLLGGCLDWRAGYTHAARKECLANPDDRDRTACLESVARYSHNKADQRRRETD